MTRVIAARIGASIIVALLGLGSTPAVADDLRQDLREDRRLDLRQDMRTPTQPQTTSRKDKGAAAQNKPPRAKQSADHDALEDPQSIKDAKRGFR